VFIDTNILDARPIFQQKASESTHSLYYLIVFEEINRAYVNHETSSDPMNMETMFNPILYQYINGSMSLEDVEKMIPEYKVDPSSGKLGIVSNANDPFIIPYNAVVDILINNTDGREHPMHFHGHKF
jgi:FtsP/CotA-like multicopper oxidase with cupredoxin domain